jgi:hypothetical protein
MPDHEHSNAAGTALMRVRLSPFTAARFLNQVEFGHRIERRAPMLSTFNTSMR